MLRSTISSWRTSESSSNLPLSPKPALLIKLFTHRPRLIASATTRVASLGWARSATMTWALPTSAASASSRSLRRATSTTSSPRFAHCRANSTPSPADAPVIRVAGRGVAAIDLRHGRLQDLAWLTRRLPGGECVDMFHTALDLAPDRILVVEERGVVEADEKLAVGAVRVLGAGH